MKTVVKIIFTTNIAAFQLVGYSAWNGEGAGSSPACYTKWPVRLMVQDTTLSMW
jgi:hypothetical protein